MSSFTTEFKVGLFAIAAVGLLVYFVMRTDDRENSLFGKPNMIGAEVTSVEGVQTGTAVEMAGVSIGSVHSLTLTSAGRAEVVMAIETKYKLPVDSRLAMKTRGLLGDRFIQIIPGTSDQYLTTGGRIENIEKGLDVDALTAKAEVIVDDIARISTGLKDLISDEETKGKVERILDNLDRFGEALPAMASTTQADLDRVVAEIRVLTKQMQDLIGGTNQVVQRAGVGVDKEMDKLVELTAKLDQAVADVASITGKIDRGEGTVGALLSDTELIERINGTVTDIQDLVGTVGRMKSTVGYRGELFVSGRPDFRLSSRNALEINLMPREDYGYLIELVSDPLGSISEEEVYYYGTWYDGTQTSEDDPGYFYERRITDDFTYSFQLQRRWQHLGLRFGIKYGTGGIGADYFLLGDKLSLRADLFDFQRRALPNLKLQAHLNLLGLLYLGVGVDDTLNGVDGLTRQLDSFRGTPYGPAVFVGGGFTFEDDDIKLMLRALPISP